MILVLLVNVAELFGLFLEVWDLIEGLEGLELCAWPVAYWVYGNGGC